MLRAVLFDLDGTLFDRASSVGRLALRQHARFPELAGVPAERYTARFLELDSRGYVPKDQVYAALAAEVGAPHLAGALFEDFRARYHDDCAPMPGANELLRALAARGLRLGIVTNGGDAFQRRTVAALGLGAPFGCVLTSEGEGVRKPDPAIFHRACARLGAEPREALFVGDHPAVDVDGAAAAGLRAVWLRDDEWPPPLHAWATIERLDELLALLG